MYGFRPRTSGYVENFVHSQIGFRCGRRSNGIGFMRFTDMQRSAIDVRINGDSGDAHFVAGTNDTHSNLSAIGDQNLLEHLDKSQRTSAVPPRFYMRDRGMCRRQITRHCDFVDLASTKTYLAE